MRPRNILRLTSSKRSSCASSWGLRSWPVFSVVIGIRRLSYSALREQGQPGRLLAASCGMPFARGLFEQTSPTARSRVMRWAGQAQSENIEDRRGMGMGGGQMMMGGGLGTMVLLLLVWLFGGDPFALLQQMN